MYNTSSRSQIRTSKTLYNFTINNSLSVCSELFKLAKANDIDVGLLQEIPYEVGNHDNIPNKHVHYFRSQLRPIVLTSFYHNCHRIDNKDLLNRLEGIVNDCSQLRLICSGDTNVWSSKWSPKMMNTRNGHQIKNVRQFDDLIDNTGLLVLNDKKKPTFENQNAKSYIEATFVI